MNRPSILRAGVIVFATAAVIFAAFLVGRASAGTPRLSPVHCHPITCAQQRVTITYTHGQPTVTITERRIRPTESRSPLIDRPAPWRPWRVIGVVVKP